jgi:type VI secretion system secreted protein Hcp
MAFDAFLKVDGIKGESQDDKHKGEIQLISYKFGADQPASSKVGGGGGVGKVNMRDLAVKKEVDAASPLLYKACWTGKHIPSAVLSVRKAGGSQQDYCIVTLKDLLVSSVENTGHANGGDNLPTEEVSLNFAEIKVEYKEQKADGSLGGSVMAGYNVKTMKEV